MELLDIAQSVQNGIYYSTFRKWIVSSYHYLVMEVSTTNVTFKYSMFGIMRLKIERIIVLFLLNVTSKSLIMQAVDKE